MSLSSKRCDVIPLYLASGKKLCLIAGVTLILLSISLITGCLESPYGPPDGSGNVLVEYHRTGGIAGFDDHLLIHENGTAMVSRRGTTGTFTLATEELVALNTLFEQARFHDLRSSYPAPTPGADYFSYEITYRSHTVTTEDTGVPPVLTPIIGRLNELLQRSCETDDICPV